MAVNIPALLSLELGLFLTCVECVWRPNLRQVPPQILCEVLPTSISNTPVIRPDVISPLQLQLQQPNRKPTTCSSGTVTTAKRLRARAYYVKEDGVQWQRAGVVRISNHVLSANFCQQFLIVTRSDSNSTFCFHLGKTGCC